MLKADRKVSIIVFQVLHFVVDMLFYNMFQFFLETIAIANTIRKLLSFTHSSSKRNSIII